MEFGECGVGGGIAGGSRVGGDGCVEAEEFVVD